MAPTTDRNIYKPRYKIAYQAKSKIWPYKNSRLRRFFSIRGRWMNRCGVFRRCALVSHTIKWTVARRYIKPYVRRLRSRREKTRYKSSFYLKQQVKHFYGKLTEVKLRSIYKTHLMDTLKRNKSFFIGLECRADMFFFRLRFLPTIYSCNQYVHYHGLVINKLRIEKSPSAIIKTGDTISIPVHHWKAIYRYVLYRIFYRAYGKTILKKRQYKLIKKKCTWLRRWFKRIKKNKKKIRLQNKEIRLQNNEIRLQNNEIRQKNNKRRLQNQEKKSQWFLNIKLNQGWKNIPYKPLTFINYINYIPPIGGHYRRYSPRFNGRFYGRFNGKFKGKSSIENFEECKKILKCYYKLFQQFEGFMMLYDFIHHHWMHIQTQIKSLNAKSNGNPDSVFFKIKCQDLYNYFAKAHYFYKKFFIKFKLWYRHLRIFTTLYRSRSMKRSKKYRRNRKTFRNYQKLNYSSLDLELKKTKNIKQSIKRRPRLLTLILSYFYSTRLQFAQLEADYDEIKFNVQSLFNLHVMNGEISSQEILLKEINKTLPVKEDSWLRNLLNTTLTNDYLRKELLLTEMEEYPKQKKKKQDAKMKLLQLHYSIFIRRLFRNRNPRRIYYEYNKKKNKWTISGHNLLYFLLNRRYKKKRYRTISRLTKIHWFIPTYIYFDFFTLQATLLHPPATKEIILPFRCSLSKIYSFYKTLGL